MGPNYCIKLHNRVAFCIRVGFSSLSLGTSKHTLIFVTPLSRRLVPTMMPCLFVCRLLILPGLKCIYLASECVPSIGVRAYMLCMIWLGHVVVCTMAISSVVSGVRFISRLVAPSFAFALLVGSTVYAH